MMTKMETRAQDNKREAMQLNLMGKHREALQKISIAIDTNPVVADFHVLR
jgi:predicted metal-dependent peptidase